MITLGVLFFVLAYQNEAQEKKKFSDNKVPEKGTLSTTQVQPSLCSE